MSSDSDDLEDGLEDELDELGLDDLDETDQTTGHPDPTREGLVLPVWLLIAAVVGLYAAASLVLDKISYFEQLAAGKSPVLGCNLNPIVGCGNVINTPQASIFGNVPNPVIGVVAWSALGALAITLITQRRLPSWFWIGLQVGATGGIVMVSWLQYQSIFHLNALCPWCMVTWAVMIPTFWSVTSHNLRRWLPGLPTRRFDEYVVLVIAAHYLVLFAVIWNHFGSKLFA
ncbi:MAG: vitamin K epoxide reductase family protein [Nocardioides sp.]|uniref:vitamin K epoxide reductase family protein n=1 Tax=Nocardioides sp. TaxID=35761 RepID=UPI0039E5F061